MIGEVSALVHYNHTHDAEHWQRLPVRISTIITEDRFSYVSPSACIPHPGFLRTYFFNGRVVNAAFQHRLKPSVISTQRRQGVDEVCSAQSFFAVRSCSIANVTKGLYASEYCYYRSLRIRVLLRILLCKFLFATCNLVTKPAC